MVEAIQLLIDNKKNIKIQINYYIIKNEFPTNLFYCFLDFSIAFLRLFFAF
jgi:hypothetical protein